MRLKVIFNRNSESCQKASGWINLLTSENELLVERLYQADNYLVGDMCEIKSLVCMRARESLSSEVLGHLSVGSIVRIYELGETTSRRALVKSSGSDAEQLGWISLINQDGFHLVEKRRDPSDSSAISIGSSGSAIIKSFFRISTIRRS